MSYARRRFVPTSLLPGAAHPALARPGHNVILQDGDTDYIVHHAYDADNVGVETLRIAPLDRVDGWPALCPSEDAP